MRVAKLQHSDVVWHKWILWKIGFVHISLSVGTIDINLPTFHSTLKCLYIFDELHCTFKRRWNSTTMVSSMWNIVICECLESCFHLILLKPLSHFVCYIHSTPTLLSVTVHLSSSFCNPSRFSYSDIPLKAFRFLKVIDQKREVNIFPWKLSLSLSFLIQLNLGECKKSFTFHLDRQSQRIEKL